jgi:CBS domain containing-hemolysin-like protein
MTSEKRTEIITKKNTNKELHPENRDDKLLEDDDESNILNRIFKLGDVRVYEVMRPRTEIIGIEINSTIDETLDSFIESGYSKMPVYEENLDNIKGFVSSYDLFKKPNSIKEIIRNILFVPETKKCTDMLKEFSINKASFAIAVDEFGGTAGIITMEDLIEELLGEIKDEYDTEEEICRKIADNTFIINGKAEIDFVNENFNMRFPRGEYSTVAGFITYFVGRIPKKGEIIKLDKFRFTILKTTPTRIELVKAVIVD